MVVGEFIIYYARHLLEEGNWISVRRTNPSRKPVEQQSLANYKEMVSARAQEQITFDAALGCLKSAHQICKEPDAKITYYFSNTA